MKVPFGDIDMTSSVTEDNNGRSLRAVVQYLNLKYARQIRLHGHEIAIEHDSTTSTSEEYSTDDGDRSDGVIFDEDPHKLRVKACLRQQQKHNVGLLRNLLNKLVICGR